MSNFPSSLDNSTTLPNPTGTSTQASPDHAGLHTNENTSIIAVETKLGIGASTPTNGLLLTGNGSGSSAWSTQAPSGAIVGTTDTQVLTNKTLTSPIINAPTITNANITADAINGYTSANAGTIYGVSISGGAIVGTNSVNGSSLVAQSIPSGAYGLGSITNTAIANATIAAAKIDYTTFTHARAASTGAQSITDTSGANNIVNLGALPIATSDVTLSGNKLTLKTAGVYILVGTASTTDVENIFFQFWQNSAGLEQLSFKGVSTQSGYMSATGTTMINAAANDVVYIQYQNRTATTTLNTATLAVFRVG